MDAHPSVPAPAGHRGRAAMTIDVEDWFHVENLSPAIRRDSWRAQQLRVERNMDRLLALLAEAPVGPVRATCFILGWLADRCPALVTRVAAAGHEIASHGYGHELVTGLSQRAFRADVARSKAVLEDLAGADVRGYRAPSFSITDWSIPILQDVGYVYDASVFPAFAHDRYGSLAGLGPGDAITEIRPGFYEIGVSCLMLGGRGIPWGGGGYFRLIPYGLFRRGVEHVLDSGRPYVFYIHPWEIDPGQPRIGGIGRMRRFRHYVGLGRCERRLASLVAGFSWTTVEDVLERWRSTSASTGRVVGG